MIIEYSIYDISLSDEEIKKLLSSVVQYNPNTVSVLLPHIKVAKSVLSGTGINISTPIDYPLGILDTKNRAAIVETAIKAGANIVNLVAQPHFFCNRKYDKFREDIKTNLEVCTQASVELRYMLEYRVFTYELLYKVSQIMMDFGIDVMYPSTGHSLDDINDNILASALINKKVPINIICNGNVWNIGHINNIKKIDLYGIKVNSINALELLLQK